MKRLLVALLSSLSLAFAAIEVDITYLQKEVQNDPSNVPYRLILAKYYLQHDNYTLAGKYTRKVLALDPKNRQALLLNKKIEQRTALQKLLPDTQLSNPFAIEKRLGRLERANRCRNFLAIYEKLGEASVDTTDITRRDAALCYAKEGKYDQAEQILQKNRFAADEKLIVTQALLSLSRNDLRKAKQLQAMLKKRYPSSRYTAYLKRKILHAESAQANEAAQKAFSKNSLKALQDYIYLLSQQKKDAEAIRAAERFIAKNPKNRDAKILLAKLYYWHGKLDKAFHTLYPLRLTNNETKKLYANILYERHDYTHALYYLPALAAKERDPAQRYNLRKRTAFAYAYTGEKQKAKALFHKLLKEHPEDHEILQFQNQYENRLLLEHAIAAYRAKRFPEALQYYHDYYDRTKDPKIAKEIAEIYYFKQQYAESFPYFQAYLGNYPSDLLITFHLASALEKEKRYRDSIPYLERVAEEAQGELQLLGTYHHAYALMQLQNDADWLKARHALQRLEQKLSATPPSAYGDLKKYVALLLKKAMGPVQKPTYYKDIVLTEGAKKDLDTEAVFSDVNFYSTTKPSLKTLLHITHEKVKPYVVLTMESADDSQTAYVGYQAKVANLMAIRGIRYSAVAKKYRFGFKSDPKTTGKGFFLQAGTRTMRLGLGIEQIGDLNTLVPTFVWSPVYGIHTFYIEAAYRNGIFSNYRRCMLDNDIRVMHLGIYDKILMENLSYTELALNINAYDDHNTNLYATINVPLYSTAFMGMTHAIYLNENIDYNTKTDVCYHPSKLYDSTYLKYRPKFTFKNGSIEVGLGKGYSFQNGEAITSYMLKGDYRVKNLAKFEINCEQLQSSFTTDDILYCTFNIIQGW